MILRNQYTVRDLGHDVVHNIEIVYLKSMVHGGCVYIFVNVHHTVFYVGVTADLYSRSTDHKEKINPKSFTARYNVSKLVYYEAFYSIEEAIAREKQIKKYSRSKKIALIVSFNPEWKDLYEDIKFW